MMKTNYVSIVSFVFLIIGVVHALRALGGWVVEVGSVTIPMWVSWAAVVVAFYLSFQGFRLTKSV